MPTLFCHDWFWTGGSYGEGLGPQAPARSSAQRSAGVLAMLINASFSLLYKVPRHQTINLHSPKSGDHGYHFHSSVITHNAAQNISFHVFLSVHWGFLSAQSNRDMNNSGWTLSPKDMKSSSLEPVNIPLLGKRVSAEMIKSRILRWRNFPGLCMWTLNVVTYIFLSGSQGEITHICTQLATCCSVAKLCLTLQPHGLQHARLPCPSLSPWVCSNSCPSMPSNLLILHCPLLIFLSLSQNQGLWGRDQSDAITVQERLLPPDTGRGQGQILP